MTVARDILTILLVTVITDYRRTIFLRRCLFGGRRIVRHDDGGCDT
jgi:hypothetical protein